MTTTQDKFRVEISLTDATIERLAEKARRLGTTVEQEIETLLEADTLLELGGL